MKHAAVCDVTDSASLNDIHKTAMMVCMQLTIMYTQVLVRTYVCVRDHTCTQWG